VTSRSYLSIGDVLTLLRQEFPDVTISKIRFLESQGLVNPERTPSGYRKFYEQDVERLRWVLRQQREHFLPLKVIKDRLGDDAVDSVPAEGSDGADRGTATAVAANADGHASGDAAGARADHRADEPVLVGQRPRRESVATGREQPAGPGEGNGLPGMDSASDPVRVAGVARSSTGPSATSPNAPAATSLGTPAAKPSEAPGRPGPVAVADDARGGGRSAPTTPGRGEGVSTANPSAPRPPRVRGNDGPAATDPGPRSEGQAEAGSRGTAAPPPANPPIGPEGGASLSLEELSAACGLDLTVLAELQEFGLLVPKNVAGLEYFDDGALAVATLAAQFARFGIEPRHLRLYKNAADREAGFVEQIVLPLVRQRNPEARARAHETADNLAGLGQQLRSALLRLVLADLLDG
jgi:DNA-binding transcriptional MerR regulator